MWLDVGCFVFFVVVGGGLTSAVTCSLLSKLNPSLEITVWEKATAAGGRMTTSRSSTNGDCFLDLGAQYVTATQDYFRDHKYYEELLRSHSLTPMAIKIEGMKNEQEPLQHFVAPSGIASLVNYYFSKSGASLNFNHRVTNLCLVDNKWIVETESGIKSRFDAVVLTMPVPEMLRLPGSVQDLLLDSRTITQYLETVRYSCRFALGLFFNKPVELPGLASAAKYIDDDSIMRWVAVDNKKRGSDLASSIVFHTSVTFGKEYKDKPLAEVQSVLQTKVREMFPGWPVAEEITCHKWEFSQVDRAYENSPGCLMLSEKPLLLAGGDGFTHSNFDGCISSAEKVVAAIARKLVE